MSFLTVVILGSLGLLLGVAIRRGFDSIYLRFRYSGSLFGLRLIAIYELCVGILFAGLTSLVGYSVITRHDQIQAKLLAFGVSPEQLLGDLLASSMLAMMAGVGLWRESRWGWSLAVFAIATGMARNVLSLVDGQHLAQRLGQSEAFYYGQHSFRTMIAAVLLSYLFRVYVMQHCGVDENRTHHFKKLLGAIVSAIGLEVLLR